MSVISLVALILLVMIAGGFYLGRTRALRLVSGRTADLHSLPNYHGYYTAISASLPAFLLLAAYGVFGGLITEQLTLRELRHEAAGLINEYRGAQASDELYQQRRETLLMLEGRGDAISRDAAAARRNDADVENARLIERLRGEQLDNLNAVTDAQDALRARGEEISAAVIAGPLGLSANVRARAGFEYENAPRERRQLFLADARRLARGDVASRDTPELREAADIYGRNERSARNVTAILAVLISIAGLVRASARLSLQFRARNRVERLITIGLFVSSGIAVLTTIGIVMSLLFESIRFFQTVPLHDFLFGLQWSPQIAIRTDQVGQSGAFGAVPLFAGTALITLIAMSVAVPIGLFSAIYLSEYAGSKFRATAKPVLEILAGIPTVVYGFFALLVVGPVIRALFSALGFEGVVTQSALSAGLVMGVMIIPFVSSLSDDVINAVPQSLRDGSYAMGATRSETIVEVVLPAALPGIVGAILLAISRAIGETMIVVMAAGRGANLTANPLEAVTTITVQIVTLLTGDQEFDSAKTLSAFALGLVLFLLTLMMNMIALRVVNRYREKYD